MGAKGGQNSDDPISEINVTPFVDVVLVLLVIFMITAPAMMKDVIGIELPKSAHGENRPSETRTLALVITEGGQWLIDGERMDSEDLVQSIRELQKNETSLQVILSADKNSKHSMLVEALDVIKSAGVKKFAIEVRREEQKSQESEKENFQGTSQIKN